MKLMKHITIALVLCAIPAVAAGQVTTDCPDCSHVLSVYYGSGGLIAEADGDSVTYSATCEGVTRSGEMMAGDDGMVSMLLTMDNGLACYGDDEDNEFEIGPIMDGGWYWLTMETNSAVGGLVSKDVLDNDTVDIADAGDGVTMMMGSGAVLLTETATGRTGLLPNILPEPPAPDAVLCGPRYSASADAYTLQQTSNCMLGGGGTKIRLTGPTAHGRTGMITSGVVTRPATGDMTIMADLWVDESGSYSTADPITPALGWAGKDDAGTNWLSTTFTVTVDNAPPGVAAAAALAGANVALTDAGGGSTPAGQATITISASPANYCPARGTQTTAVLNILAAVDATNTNNLHPATSALARSGALANFTAATQIRVACPPPASSANMGEELVPENPFPTSE
ncbi:MAG: hypothetical protein F4060_15255 [Holophagales bacterium]|nr:hypothetical protein [Holophagales bacterium]MYG30845.1 hypothetical protein [Holophagales bacterium]MYI81288.1 hypothetical protein [Holophagales bacterium]